MKVPNLLKIFRLLLDFLVAWFRSRNDLALENFALRQQLATFQHEQARPNPTSMPNKAFLFYYLLDTNNRYPFLGTTLRMSVSL